MSDIRQMSLFNDQPQTTDDLNRHTPLGAITRLFEQFLAKSGKSENTRTAFLSDLALVSDYLDPATPVGQITTTMLNHFLHWLEFERGVSCSRKSYARRVTTLKVFFKWLHGLGVIPIDPAKALLQRSGPAPLSHVLSESQIADAIDYSRTMRTRKDEHDYRPEMLFRLLLDTGIKKSEIEQMQPHYIDRTNPAHPILMARTKHRDVYRERRIPLDPDWLPLYDLYATQYPPDPEENRVITCTTRNLEYILTEIGEGAGIPFKLSFEVMRWTCGVRDYRNGMDERAIREKLGLSEASWTETGRKIKVLSEQLTHEEGGLGG